MKQIYLTLLVLVTASLMVVGQTADLVLSSAESGNQLHQATNSITFTIGYSYTPNGGTMTAEILKAGDTREMPIIAGQFSDSFTFTDTRNTVDFTNKYTGKTTNDVFYKFTLTRRMTVVMTHCGSALSNTFMSLLDASGVLIGSNDNYSGDGHCTNTYQAFIRMDLEAGAYYVVSEGNYGDGFITTAITGYYDEFSYPDSPDYYSSDPDAVGATQGNLVISETGAATINVPVMAPVGVGGMQPTISIVYNSQAGNGIAGWGANLTGTSAITRTPKSVYYDTTAKGLTYLGADAYVLDGKRLIYYSGNAGQEGAIYYPESDPFTKVIVHGTYSGTTCNTWFEVISKDGMKYTYGNTPNSKQTISGGKVTAWYLNQVEDPLGNYMDYTYTSGSYFVYLSSVSYGKNKNVSTTFENKVEFTYESRPDPVLFVLDATKGGMYQRLSKVKTKTGTTTYREYELQYANSDQFSRLVSVTGKNGNGEALKPIRLNWNYLPSFSQQCIVSSVSAASVYPAVPFDDQAFQAADLNGDGITDLVSVFPIRIPTGPNSWINKNYAYIYWGSLNAYGNPQFLTGNYYDIGADLQLDDWKEQTAGCTPIDFDGNGIMEMVVPHLSISDLGKYVEFKFVSGTPDNITVVDILQNTNEMPLYATGDFNNDGKGDLAYIEKGNSNGYYLCKIVGLNSGTTLYSASFSLLLPSKPEKIFASDFNGNGLSDVIIFYNGGYKIFWNQGNGISSQTLSNSYMYSSTTLANNKMMRMGDFNGDGLPDFIMNDSGSTSTGNSSWYIALNNGNGTFAKYLACTLPVFDQTFTGKDDDKFDCQVFDFDLDGKSDVVIHKAMYDKKDDMWSSPWGVYRETLTYWMRSTGTALSQVSYARSTNEADAFSKFMVTGDFNGDGKIELMNYGYNCYNGSGTTQSWRYYKNPGLTTGSGMIASVTSGMGGASSISYAPLTQASVYIKGTGAAYPLIDITPPMSAVTSVTYDNGIAGTMNETYSYKGAKVHLQGKGFMGFMTTIASNTTKGITAEKGTASINTTWFAPAQTYSKTTVNANTAETTVDYTYVDKGSKKFFAYPNKKTDKDLDGNTNTTYYTYNSTYGYLTDEKTEYGSSSMYKKTELRNYILAGGRYQPQLINSIGKHADDSQEFIQKTSLTYDATKGYPKTKVENDGTSLALTTEFVSYDGFGNLKESKVSGFGVPALTSYTDYDATNRFPAKVYTTPSSSVVSYTYDTWGNPLTEKDETNPANLLTTTHAYDTWGRATTSILPDGRKTVYRSGWNDNIEKRYFTLTMGNGQPWVKQWYDRTGRETVTETIGPKGMDIVITRQYNNKGELESTDTQQGDLLITESYQYDARGRIKQQSSSSGQSITYGYGNRQVTTTRNGQNYVQTFDAWGNLVFSTDPLSNVSYEYKSLGKPKSITTGGATFTMDYDAAGNQKQLVDPNAGTINYTYDAAGRVKTQDDARGNHYEAVYDVLGRIDYSELAGVTTDYAYGTTGYDLNRLIKVTTGNNYISYLHDQYGRVYNEKRQVGGTGILEYGYAYNSNGQLQTTTYPGGVQLGRTYDASGNLETVTAGGQAVWSLTNASGTVTTAQLGSTMTSTTTLNSDGLLTKLKTVKGSTVVRELNYSFDRVTGNLNWRSDASGVERFFYDGLDRLEKVDNPLTGIVTMDIDYHANGNIKWKTGLGDYEYIGFGPHALSAVDNTDNLIQAKGQHIGYTTFNKAEILHDTLGADAYRLDITYGPDRQRWKSALKKNGSDVKTIIFGGDYEKVTQNGVTRELYYIGGGDGLAAVYVKQAGQSDKIYYTHTDHLGSIISLTDANGTSLFKATYDAWGKQTVTQNTIGFHRGYTGHEHLPEFGLIDMNGRMYDPLLGRFLSPDNYVQLPDFSQNVNRYSYCFNNPMKYNDPSGEIAWLPILAMAYFGGMQANFFTADNPFNPGDWNWKSSSTYIGIGSGAMSGLNMTGSLGTFMQTPGAIPNGILQSGIQVGINGIGNVIDDDPFFQGWAGPAAMGFVSGAISGYSIAQEQNRILAELGIDARVNPWTGRIPRSNIFAMEYSGNLVASSAANDYITGPVDIMKGDQPIDDIVARIKYLNASNGIKNLHEIVTPQWGIGSGPGDMYTERLGVLNGKHNYRIVQRNVNEMMLKTDPSFYKINQKNGIRFGNSPFSRKLGLHIIGYTGVPLLDIEMGSKIGYNALKDYYNSISIIHPFDISRFLNK